MNRQLKFREWLGKEFHCWGFMEDGSFILPTNIKGPQQQMTGLLDKNGKEIWEGDIIERSDSGVIEFDGGMFGVNWDFGTDKKTMLGAWGTETNLRCLHDGYNREIEVIGNIYENPDLLK